MRHWFNDIYFRSVFKNSSYLAGSKVVAAVAGLATLAFAGRSLGLVQLGSLILITSYAQAASGLTKFQSWQLIVRYGGNIRDSKLGTKFKTATGFAFALDVTSGLVGMVLAMIALPFAGPWFGLEPEQVGPALLYCMLIPTMAAATPNGVVRVLDRFDLLSWQGMVTPISRAALSAVAWWQGWSLNAFLALWFATDLAGDLLIWFYGWRELRRHDLHRGIRPTLRPAGLERAWPFAIYINLTSSLSSAWGPIARLIVGGLLGEASAALYRVAATLADSAQKPADLLARAYYPEVARMDMASKHPWRLMKRSLLTAAMVGGAAILIVLLGGKQLIGLLFGPQFTGAYAALVVMLVVPLLTIVSFPLPSTLYALDRPGGPLHARIVATLAYFAIVVPLTRWLGLTGAALAFTLANVALVVVLAWLVRREYVRVRAPARAAERAIS